jgi:hypothetical protein
MPIAIINMGGVRGEDHFFTDLDPHQKGEQGVRVDLSTDQLLPGLVSRLRQAGVGSHHQPSNELRLENSTVFKDMLS